MNLLKQFNLWRAIARDYTLPQTVVSYAFAVLLASKNYQVDIFLSLLGLFGVLLVHMSVNILDDYFDWKSGAVEEYKKLLAQGEQVKTHKCFYLEQGLTSHKSLLIVALSMDAIALLIGLFIATKVGITVLVIAFLAAFLGFFYSAPPFKFSYRGMSELVIGVVYGPLLLSGAYVVAGGSVDKLILYSSLIVGILVANISFVHCIMDFKSDKNVGKTSLATLMGSQKNAVYLLAFLYLLAYILVLIGVLFNISPEATFITYILIPKNIALIKMMSNDDRKKRVWMGYLENWDHVIKEGADWFMLRLCLSRNLVIDFILIFGLAYCLFS